MRDFIKYVNESSLSRIWDKVEKYTCGAITGYRNEQTNAENKQANKEILIYLKTKGYSITSVKGNYIENFGTSDAKEVGENSFFVANQKVEGDDGGALESVLKKLGLKYNQDSVLIVPVGGKGAYLLGTSKKDTAEPAFNQKFVTGNAKFGQVAGKYLSRIKNREFAFESVDFPGTINGLRGWEALTEEIDKDLQNYSD